MEEIRSEMVGGQAVSVEQSAETLRFVRGLYEGAVGSAAYGAWRKEAKEAWAFYDGHQWTEEERSALAEHGQPAIVINKIATKIDNVAGTEIAGRTRVLYRSRSGDATEEATASALSDLALYVAERGEQSLEISDMFREGLVTGIGWLDVGVEASDEGVRVFTRCEDALSVVWDVEARRADFSDARFVCRERWLGEDALRHLFQDEAEGLIRKLRSKEQGFGGGSLGGGGAWSLGGRAFEDISYVDADKGLFRVVEVQYKRTEKLFTVGTQEGRSLVTFDEAAALAALDSLDGAVLETAYAPRVYVACFCEDVLLTARALDYDHNQFTLVPYVFKRDRQDGRPYGLVRFAIDPQRELNKRRSKAMHLLNTAQVIADIDAVEDPAMLAREAARPDGVLLKRPGKELQIIRHTELAGSQIAVMEHAGRDIQEVMGVFDEAIGKTSNATSGVAIQSRQMASTLNRMFAFDALRRAKKKMGEMVLSLIRQLFTTEMVIHITDDLGAPRVVHLNGALKDDSGAEVLDDRGEPVRLNDVRSGVFDVYVEEVKDVLSGRELELEQLNMLRAAGVPVPASVLVAATDVRGKDEILRALA